MSHRPKCSHTSEEKGNSDRDEDISFESDVNQKAVDSVPLVVFHSTPIEVKGLKIGHGIEGF
jgi:hypothetical protein